jgi:hypothetical protein
MSRINERQKTMLLTNGISFQAKAEAYDIFRKLPIGNGFDSWDVWTLGTSEISVTIRLDAIYTNYVNEASTYGSHNIGFDLKIWFDDGIKFEFSNEIINGILVENWRHRDYDFDEAYLADSVIDQVAEIIV